MNVCITRKRAVSSWPVAVACFALFPVAHAEPDPFGLTVGETVTRDDNLLRGAQGSETPDLQSDSRVRLDYNNTIGRNRAMAWASVDDSRYRNNSQLDNLGYSLGGEFDWATLNHLSGRIGGDDDSSLYRTGVTGDQPFQGKSILHTRRAFARAALGGPAALGAEGGLEYSSSKNSAAVLVPNDLNQWVGDLGMYYMQSPSLRISLLGRRTGGKFPDALPAPIDFHRNDLILASDWTIGATSSVQTQLAYSQEDYAGFSARHYWTGFLRGAWPVTGHIRITVSLARDTTQNFAGGVLGQIPDSGSPGGTTVTQPGITQQSQSLNDVLDLSGLWQLTSKISLTGSYLRAVRHYDGVAVGNTGPLNGTDSSAQYQLKSDYLISRSIKAGCSVARSTHSPGDLVALSNAYVSNAYSCFAELSIQ